ncbi:MAG: hypothetical protein QXX38_01945, partial [Candidatus Aenigmatarchaeota archaeon]
MIKNEHINLGENVNSSSQPKFCIFISVVEEFIRLISPVTKVNMCEKDPENDWQCKDEGATGVFYNFENQLGPKYIDAEGLTPGNWYRVELVNKGEYCTLWEPLNSGPAYDNRVMFYAQADSEGKLHMEFTLE